MKLGIAILFFGALAEAAPILKCEISERFNKNVQEVPVFVESGATINPDNKPMKYGDHSVSVNYNLGDRFEPQTWLRLMVDKTFSLVYNVSEESFFELNGEDYRLRCSFKN